MPFPSKSLVSAALSAHALLSLVAPAHAATSLEWRSRSIYQVIVDRFARTDGSTTEPCDVTKKQYCGGTWKGLEQKLDYISDMGFTAVSCAANYAIAVSSFNSR